MTVSSDDDCRTRIQALQGELDELRVEIELAEAVSMGQMEVGRPGIDGVVAMKRTEWGRKHAELERLMEECKSV